MQNNKEIELLPEIWLYILSKLDCESILCFYSTCAYFRKLCLDDEGKNYVYLNKKFEGFPRKEGECASHDISELAEVKELMKTVTEELSTNHLIILNSIALPYLGKKLVRGDFVVHDYGYAIRRSNEHDYLPVATIYDGHKLLFYDRSCDETYGNLPPKFTILDKGVPMRYWEAYTSENMLNNIVWLNIKDCNVKDQCVSNKSEWVQSTWFEYDNNIYNIQPPYEICSKPFIWNFKDNLLMLTTCSSFAENYTNTLFITNRYNYYDLS